MNNIKKIQEYIRTEVLSSIYQNHSKIVDQTKSSLSGMSYTILPFSVIHEMSPKEAFKLIGEFHEELVEYLEKLDVKNKAVRHNLLDTPQAIVNLFVHDIIINVLKTIYRKSISYEYPMTLDKHNIVLITSTFKCDFDVDYTPNFIK